MANKSAINLLQEMTIKQGFFPEYTFLEKRIDVTGIEFTCIVTCKQLHASGTGMLKKVAKHNAARSMIALLTTNKEFSPVVNLASTANTSSPVANIPQSPAKVCETSPSCTQSNDNRNYIGSLQELCQQRGISPIYELIYDEGLPNMKTFTMDVIVGSQRERGTGSSKKAAKHEAARKMLLRLNQGKTNLNTTNLDSGKSNVVKKNMLLDIDELDVRKGQRLENKIKSSTTILECTIKEIPPEAKLTEKAISRFLECKQDSGINHDINSTAIKNLHTLFGRNYSDKISSDLKKKMQNIKRTNKTDLHDIRRDIESSLKVKIENFAVRSIPPGHLCGVRLLTIPRITQCGAGETKEAAESDAMYNLVTAILIFLND